MKNLIVLRGGGDIATGIAYRLVKSGFLVIILETIQPTMVRRTVSFAQAVYDGEVVIEGVTGKLFKTTKQAIENADIKTIPIIIDPPGHLIKELNPLAVIDAILAKKNIGTNSSMASIVIGVGPGFNAGEDVHAVVETQRGHYLGRVIYKGAAILNTGIPGDIGGYTIERVLRSPGKGVFRGIKLIGDLVQKGDTIAFVGDQPVYATIAGVLRGMLQDGIIVNQGFKIADIDPRAEVEHCYSISDKARSIGGGVLEALLNIQCTRGEDSC